jgi:NIPSNAP protein
VDRRDFLAMLGVGGLAPDLVRLKPDATSLRGLRLQPDATSLRGVRLQPDQNPEFYVWRHYQLHNGTQPGRMASFLREAAVPALNRLGHKPVGVFEVVAGVQAPAVFMLTAHPTLDSVATMEARLERDAEFMKAAAPYVDATAADPAYGRQDVSILAAFPKFPRLAVPAAAATNGPRLFELRTYESHNERAHRMKVRMFEELGEIEIFKRVGLAPVFFSRTLAGRNMPSLTYMLVHENMATRQKSWEAFGADPEWKKVRSTPGFSDAEIVSNITTVLLRPAGYSQI